MPPVTSTPITQSVQGNDFGSIFGNVLTRVADLATIDFLYDRNLNYSGQTAEKTIQGQPVDNIAGERPSSPIYTNPYVIGGVAIGLVLITVLLVRK